jgi:hypothetical protein
VNATSGNLSGLRDPVSDARGLHVRLVHTRQDHGPGTITAKPEVFQPLATHLCKQNELINLAITQVVEFPPAVRIGALADHHTRPWYRAERCG